MSIQGSGEHPTLPAQWLYGLWRDLPGRAGLVVTVAGGIASDRLDASIGASGPHAFAVRSRAVRYRHYQRPPLPAPRSWRS